jgi:hypothetical protein
MAPSSLTPVHFFSHGSTMMLGEESDSATYWKACGDAALANGIKHVVMMVSWKRIASCLLYSHSGNYLTILIGSTLGNPPR